MKKLYLLVVLALLFPTGCSEDNPLEAEPGTKLGADAMPMNSAVPYHAVWTTQAINPPPLDCDVLLPGFPPFGIAGEGFMTYLGPSTWVSISNSDDPVAGQQAGCTLIIAADGDELWCEYLGSFNTIFDSGGIPTGLAFSGDIAYDGGTGKFETATGHGTYVGSFDFATSSGQVEETGTLSLPRMVPFHASLHNTIEVVPPFPPPVINGIFEGGGVGTYLGDFDLLSTSQVDVTTTPQSQTGQAVLTAANGDELSFLYQGTATEDPPGVANFNGDFTFTGGTGRFANATGGGTYGGTADLVGENPMGQWEMHGSISRVGSR